MSGEKGIWNARTTVSVYLSSVLPLPSLAPVSGTPLSNTTTTHLSSRFVHTPFTFISAALAYQLIEATQLGYIQDERSHQLERYVWNALILCARALAFVPA